MPEDHARGLFLHVEKIHLAPQLAVVAFLRLFQHMQMRLEVVLVLERHPINPLQHLVFAVTTPIGPGNRGQLERIGRHLACMNQMRTPAQILPVAVPVHSDLLAFRDHADQFDLVGLIIGFIELECPLTLPQFGCDRFALVDDLAHFLFDHAEVFRGKRLLPVKIIVKPVIDHRPDSDFDIRPDLLHGARHDMGGVMADELKRLCVVFHRVNGEIAVSSDRLAEVAVLAVDRAGYGGFGKRFGDIGSNIHASNAACVAAFVAIGKGQGNIGHVGSAPSVWRLRNARLRL